MSIFKISFLGRLNQTSSIGTDDIKIYIFKCENRNQINITMDI